MGEKLLLLFTSLAGMTRSTTQMLCDENLPPLLFPLHKITIQPLDPMTTSTPPIKPERPKLTLPKKTLTLPVQSTPSAEAAVDSADAAPLVRPVRSILKAKSLRIVIPAKPVPVVAPVKPIKSASPAKPDKADTPAKAAKAAKPPQDTKKEQLRLENIRRGSEAHARKVAQFAKAKPPIHAYLTEKLAQQEIVLVDGVECFRPLMLGIHKQIFALFKSQPELQDCSNTVIYHIVSEMLEKHVSKPQYLAGMLKFNERFDFDGNPTGEILDKHKIRAEKIISNIKQETE